MSNKYLSKISTIEKQAILGTLGAAAGFHVAQNLAMKGVLRSKKYSQAVADAARAGFEGKHYSNKRVSAFAGIAGKEATELPHLVNKSTQGFRQYLQSKGHSVTPHDHLALRMLSQGRLDGLARLHSRTKGKTEAIVSHATGWVKNKHGIDLTPVVGKSGGAKNVEALFKKPTGVKASLSSSNHPLLNNISSNITRGKPAATVSGGTAAGIEAGVTGALTLAEPVAGAINAGKQVLASSAAQKIPFVRKASDWVTRKFTNSAGSSLAAGAKEGSGTLGGRLLDKVRNKALPSKMDATYSRVKNLGKGTFVNGLAGELDRTAHALGAAAGRDLQAAYKANG